MKNVVVILFIALSASSVFCMEQTETSGSDRVLLLPLSVESSVDDPWEGLAPVLALQSGIVDDSRLIPFTACRRKLNEYGLSVVGPVSLATRIKLANDLGADMLVSGHLAKDRLVLLVYHTKQKRLERKVLFGAAQSDYLPDIARMLGFSFKPLASRQYDLFRVWASIYYVAEPETVRPVVDKLLEHDLTGWLFVQEYLDLFGDPAAELADAAELAWWRDFFLEKQHLARALRLSQLTMAMRHHPNDLIAHARILMAQEDFGQACAYLKKAESFGFFDQTMIGARRICSQPPATGQKVDVR